MSSLTNLLQNPQIQNLLNTTDPQTLKKVLEPHLPDSMKKLSGQQLVTLLKSKSQKTRVGKRKPV